MHSFSNGYDVTMFSGGRERACIGNKCVKTVDQKNIVLQNIGLYLGFLLMSEIKLFLYA